MRAFSNRTKLALAGAATALAVVGPISTASAATSQLNGDWAPFSRCPVDSPTMLAADGNTAVAQCVDSQSPGGSITIGSLTVPVGQTDLQFGTVTSDGGNTFTVVAPSGGALVAAPSTLPGGLLGLMCPSSIPIVSGLCADITNSTLNTVTATMVSAGAPYAFNLAGGYGTGQPIVSIPVRIHLQNPLLGSNCYIGTTSNPIVLNPQNTTGPTFGLNFFDADGTDQAGGSLLRIDLTGSTQQDATFAAPGASGCDLDLADWAVNLKSGLPAASGKNTLTLNGANTYFAGLANPAGVAPDDGATLSQDWHSAVQ